MRFLALSRSTYCYLEMLVFVEGEKQENQEKNPQSKDENQQQTQPTYDGGSTNLTGATLHGGRRVLTLRIPKKEPIPGFIM